MIPKIIHYIWFGGNQLNELQKKCIDSWKTHLPDYEIVCWDETNFDIKSSVYCAEAYEEKKWAFVSDYVRLWALVNHGGIYMDTDVEVIDSLDPFLHDAAFSGFEVKDYVPTGIMGCEKNHPFFKKLLADYDGRHFRNDDGSLNEITNVITITSACVDAGLVLDNTKQTIVGFTLYPSDYFCPKSHETGLITLTSNTRTIHHFNGSWVEEPERLLDKTRQGMARTMPFLRGKPLRALSKLVYGIRYRDFKPLKQSIIKVLH